MLRATVQKTVVVLALGSLVAGTVMAKPQWDKVRLTVLPGVGFKGVELGEPLPEKWPQELGNPDIIYPFHGTGENVRRIGWGDFSKGQLVKGIALMAEGEGEKSSVTDIVISRIRAGLSEENLFLGLPEANISKRSESVQRDGKKSYLLPGLTIETSEGKMVTLRVHSPAATRWRFKQWRMRPGEAVGPVRLGEKLDESLLESIGEPHLRKKEQLVWQASDSGQTLKIDLDPRTRAVTRIHGAGLPWRTPNGVTVGDSEATFKAKHPAAKAGFGRDYEETLLKLPGLRATFIKGRLESFDVYPTPSDP